MKHVASYFTQCLTRKPWWAHVAISLTAYGTLKAALIFVPSVTNWSIPAVLQKIPPEIVLFYPMIPLLISFFSVRKQKQLLSGQESIGRLNAMDMASFSEAVVTRLSQYGFTVVSTKNETCPNRNSIKMIRNGEMHLLFMVRRGLIGSKHIQEYSNILFTEGIHKGIVISTGLILPKTADCSGNICLEFIDGKTLLAFLAEPFQARDNPAPPVKIPDMDRLQAVINARYPLCPVCRSTMAIHLGRNISHPGKTSWKCTRRPECQGSIMLKLDTITP